jgi:hypothetical protein
MLVVERFLRRMVILAVVRRLLDRHTCSRFRWLVVIVIGKCLECCGDGDDCVILLPLLVVEDCSESVEEEEE